MNAPHGAGVVAPAVVDAPPVVEVGSAARIATDTEPAVVPVSVTVAVPVALPAVAVIVCVPLTLEPVMPTVTAPADWTVVLQTPLPVVPPGHVVNVPLLVVTVTVVPFSTCAPAASSTVMTVFCAALFATVVAAGATVTEAGAPATAVAVVNVTEVALNRTAVPPVCGVTRTVIVALPAEVGACSDIVSAVVVATEA